jgi:hypothetical protein
VQILRRYANNTAEHTGQYNELSSLLFIFNALRKCYTAWVFMAVDLYFGMHQFRAKLNF